MGPWKQSVLPLTASLLVAAVCIGPASACKSDKRGSVSSESFNGIKVVESEVLVSELEVLREVYRRPPPDGTTDSDISLLDKPTPTLNVLGKLGDGRLVVYETVQKHILTIDLEQSATPVRKVLTKEDLFTLFSTTTPILGGPSAPVIQLQNGWLLGYEFTSKSLYAIREDVQNPGDVLVVRVLSQAEMQAQLFPGTGTKPQMRIKNMVEFRPNQVMVVPESIGIPALDRLEVEDRTTTLAARFIRVNGTIPLVTFSQILAKTNNNSTDVRGFPPIQLPRTTKVLLFDQEVNTSAFLLIDLRQNPDGSFVSTVEVAVNRTELNQALSEFDDPTQTIDAEFFIGFLHPAASLRDGDPARKPLALLFEAKTNNLMAFDWTRPRNDPERFYVFASSTNIVNPTDLDPADNPPVTAIDPEPLFAQNDVVDNKMLFDSGAKLLLSLNYETGQFLILQRQSAIGSVTGGDAVEVRYMETLDPPPDGIGTDVRVLDGGSATLLRMRLEYLPVPVRLPPE